MSKFKYLVAVATSVMFALSFSTLVFANAGGENITSNAVVPLTPEGNLTLVDDVTTDDNSDKQFITAVTKNGNYFYLVIDRANNKDNVYLLNLVDEADLMTLIDSEPLQVQGIAPQQIVPPQVEEVPQSEEETQIETETPVEEEQPSNLPAILTVFILIGGGIFYYFKFGKGEDVKVDSDSEDFDDVDYELDDDEKEYDVDDVSENLTDYYENDEL